MATDTEAERQAFRSKLRSLGFVSKPTTSKTTTDHHGTHEVDVTETADRQDVTVRLPSIHLPKGDAPNGEVI